MYDMDKERKELMKYISVYGKLKLDRDHPYFQLGDAWVSLNSEPTHLIINGDNSKKHIKNLAKVAKLLIKQGYRIDYHHKIEGKTDIIEKRERKGYRLIKFNCAKITRSYYPNLEKCINSIIRRAS